MATLTRLHNFETDRDATPPVLFSATKVDGEFDQIITESNAQDVRLDTIEAVTYLPVDATIAATDTHIIVADGTDFDNVAVSGDATLSNTGVLTIAVDAIDGTKIADDSIDSEHYTDGSIDLAHLSADSVDGTKIADDAIDSEHYTDGSIDLAHMSADSVDGTKIADDAIDSEHYTDGSIDLAHMSADSVDGSKIVDDAIDSEHYTDGSIDSAHIGDDQIITAKILDGDVTLAKLVDATATNKVMGRVTTGSGDWEEVTLQTTLSSSDDAIPTSKAVRDDIVSIVNDVGGFHAIADDQSFPNANPDPDDGAGTVVSIANAGGLVVNGSGVSTTGRTLGSSTVTINGIPATYQSTTIADSLGMHVISTVTLNTYNYHKMIAKEGDTNIVSTNIADVNTVAGISSNVTTVAGISSDVTAVAGDASDIAAVAAKATEIGRLGTADAVADMAILGTADVVSDLNTLGTADIVTDMNTLGTAGNVTAMATCATNEASINRYSDEYTIAGSTPGSPSEGDLWYDSTNNVLKYHNGSAFVTIASGIADVVSDGSPQLGGDLDLNGNIISGVPAYAVSVGNTANVNSSQGDNAITTFFYEIATCANAGDAVTLPTAAAGKVVVVANNGAEDADVFPASGDNIDAAGVNTAYSLESGTNVMFIAQDATDWDTISGGGGSGSITTNGLYEHAHTISANYVITTNNNALTAGPITINSGISVTVPSGSTWVIA